VRAGLFVFPGVESLVDQTVQLTDAESVSPQLFPIPDAADAGDFAAMVFDQLNDLADGEAGDEDVFDHQKLPAGDQLFVGGSEEEARRLSGHQLLVGEEGQDGVTHLSGQRRRGVLGESDGTIGWTDHGFDAVDLESHGHHATELLQLRRVRVDRVHVDVVGGVVAVGQANMRTRDQRIHSSEDVKDLLISRHKRTSVGYGPNVVFRRFHGPILAHYIYNSHTIF
jgi:hypothetical protein